MIAAVWAFRVPLLGLAAAIALIVAYNYVDGQGYARGYATRVAEEAAAAKERTDAASRADDDARRCAADPDCRLRSDPFERR